MTPDIQSVITPQDFWKLYSRKLSDVGQSPTTYNLYQGTGEWTPFIIEKTKEILTQDLNLQTQQEYLRVDLIGYDKYDSHKWSIKIAYEHENTDDWDDEICKLCHVVADLRVIASYYNFRNKKAIEELLQERVDKLGANYINRVPDCSWLFIIGPRCVCQTLPFQAFSLDKDLKIKNISSYGTEIIPDRWSKADNKSLQ